MKPEQAQAVFLALRELLTPYAPSLITAIDQADHLYLDSSHIMKNNKPLFFGSVKIGKRYVSYHLMPIYVEPALLSPVSERLKQRMQGKSCFNFSRIDQPLFEELRELTGRAFEFYVTEGYIRLG